MSLIAFVAIGFCRIGGLVLDLGFGHDVSKHFIVGIIIAELTRGETTAPGEVVLEFADTGQDEAQKWGRGLEGPGEVLRVVLSGHVVGVILQLDYLHTLTLVVVANKLETRGFEIVDVLRVHFVSVMKKKK